MIPIKWSVKNNTTIFHYTFSDMRKFIKEGKETGNNGIILIKRKGNLFIFKGFGDKHYPNKKLNEIKTLWISLWGIAPYNNRILNSSIELSENEKHMINIAVYTYRNKYSKIYIS